MPVTASNPFKWRHYPGDIILWCVRWYLRFPISFAHMAEMALERGLLIHSTCIWRWVQIYGPELDKRCRAHLAVPLDRCCEIIRAVSAVLRRKAFSEAPGFAGPEHFRYSDL